MLIYASHSPKLVSADKYYDTWMMFRNDKPFIDNNMDKINEHILKMWNVLNSIDNRSIKQKQSKLIPLFCAIAFVTDSQRRRLVSKLKQSYFSYAEKWEKISGNQYAHYKRYEALKEALNNECTTTPFVFSV